MKTDLSKVDVTDFNMQDCQFGGDDCVWIFPKLEGVSWNTQNEIYRSSIWRKADGELISPGFKKFFNWEEHPNIHPAPTLLSKNINCVEKLDGSCLIVSKYKEELIIRTRRALARTMLNGDEIDYFIKKYPKVFDNWYLNNQYTLILEWITPSNKIVLDYKEPDIKLIGGVNHDNYTYVDQAYVDLIAIQTEVQRPRYRHYKSVEEMLQHITDLKDEEGVCVYYGNDQHIRKVKSEWYRTVHNFRNAMNLKNIVDLFLVNQKPSYQDFCTLVLNQFQYEGLQMAMPLISQICDAYKEVNKILKGMEDFVQKMASFSDRKTKAAHIFSSYGQTNRADIVFTILDKKPINDKQIKKLLFQKLIV